MTKPPADMEARTPAPEGAAVAAARSRLLDALHKTRLTRDVRVNCDDLHTILYAPPVVPVGVRERVLDELDKAWLHGQRRTSWRRDESADAIMAACQPVVPVGVSREKQRPLAEAIYRQVEPLLAECSEPNPEDYIDAILAALRPTDTGWRDIATAPRDGTDVLVCDDETGERHVSYWTGDCWSGRNRFKPTHWMPLLPAPTDTGRE